MKEMVLAGTPGAGKTTLIRGLLQQLKEAVLVDGQVEVPQLWRFFDGEKKTQETFKVLVPLRNFMLCASCGLCAKNCPFGAIYEEDLWIDPLECEGCGVCARNCPQRALQMANMQVGEWYRLEKDQKILFYGRLLPGAMGGPLLAEHLRREAHRLGKPVIIEAPGLGESAARLMDKAEKVVFVLTPETNALEALERLRTLAGGARQWLIINRADQDERVQKRLKDRALETGIELLGEIKDVPPPEKISPESVAEGFEEVLSRLVVVAKD